MSAIAAILRRDGRNSDVNEVRAMLAAMSHRARDGTGCRAAGAAVLGYGLSITTPESRFESQPFSSSDAGMTVVANVRLDNRPELAGLLGINPDALGSTGDAELILKAYQTWGDDCPQQLAGDFAFAIYDEPRRRLFVARDRMGAKPLYYFRSPQVFACASEIKALLALPFVPDALDDRQIGCFLEGLSLDRESTFYRNIKRLPAASTATIGPEDSEIRTYWTLDASFELRLQDSREYAEAFRSRFEEAVRCRMRSEAPVGTALSGGLDSSSITCMAHYIARNEGREPIHTFSSIFPSLPEEDLEIIDERRYIDAVLGMGGLEPHFFHADESTPIADLDAVLYHLDEPHLAYNLYLHWGMFRSASEAGVTVFLDGVDGDACVNYGFGLLEDLAIAGEWKSFGNEARHLSEVTGVKLEQYLYRYGYAPLRYLMSQKRFLSAWRQSAEAGGAFGIPGSRVFADNLYQTLVPAGVRTFWEIRRGRWEPTASLVSDDLDRATGIKAIAAESHSMLEAVQQNSRENHAAWLMLPLYQYTLELADKAGEAFGIDVRYPFFDHRLLELSLSIPVREKLSGGWTRQVLREAMKGILPEEVRMRITKAGLGPAVLRGLRKDAAAFARFFDDGSPVAPYVDLKTARRVLASLQGGGGKHALAEAQLVFRAVLLARWLEMKGAAS